MDELLDKRFERVEKALATLISSISTYNPAPNLAVELVNADAELSDGLEQCEPPQFMCSTAAYSTIVSTHQTKYSKIVSLRETSNALDAQIRETLVLLTTTRSELLATPSTSFPPNANPISYSELLSYARRISRFTLPPTRREPLATANTGEPGEAGTDTPKEPGSQPQTNGNNTPIVVTNGDAHTTTAMDIDNAPAGTPGRTQAQTSQPAGGVSTNLSIWEQYLNPSADMPFVPWPTEEAIRRGALASIQNLLDQGKDPATNDADETAQLEAKKKALDEEEERAELEQERRREMQRRMSASGPAQERREEKPKVFQLETFDDDDDDD